jgi:site-specific DNA recombinase
MRLRRISTRAAPSGPGPAADGVPAIRAERLLGDLDQGVISGIVVWKLDRLARRLEDLLRVSRILDERGAALVSVTESLDTSTASGRFMLRTMVGLAEMESANISLRTAAQRAEAARKGRPNVGGARPFGYAADKVTVIPEEPEAASRDQPPRVLRQPRRAGSQGQAHPRHPGEAGPGRHARRDPDR